MKCCGFGDFPTKYYYFYSLEKQRDAYLRVGQETHDKIQKILKENPDAKISINGVSLK